MTVGENGKFIQYDCVWLYLADVHSEWVDSIQQVIDAGPPFTDTLTNTFRSKLNDLMSK